MSLPPREQPESLQTPSSSSEFTEDAIASGPVIDHVCFPHIMETILGFCPRASLVVLRSTSKHFKKVSDMALAYHLCMTEQGIRHADGRHPALAKSSSVLEYTQILDVYRPPSSFPSVLRPSSVSFINCDRAYGPAPTTFFVDFRDIYCIWHWKGIKKIVTSTSVFPNGVMFPMSLEKLVVLTDADHGRAAAKLIAWNVDQTTRTGKSFVAVENLVTYTVVSVHEGEEEQETLRRGVHRHLSEYYWRLAVRYNTAVEAREEIIKATIEDVRFTSLAALRHKWPYYSIGGAPPQTPPDEPSSRDHL